MNPDFRIPPKNRLDLTPPDILAQRLSVLIGARFRLTRKTRTDGANARKLIAASLEQHPLPPLAPDDAYRVVPPRRKGLPRILRECIDTCLVTTGSSYNLQVWNRNPASDSVQVEYHDGTRLSAKDVRFVFVRVDPGTQKIKSVLVLTPDYIESHFGRFGRPTLKHQLIITSTRRQSILDNEPPVLFHPDTPTLSKMAAQTYRLPPGTIHAAPIKGELLSLEVLRDILIDHLIDATLGQGATKNRGQMLEVLIAQALGYTISETDLLAGDYPDICHQCLEVKIQDSSTVDLGKFSPQFEEAVAACPGLTTSDVRYLIALTDEKTGIVQGLVLCPGSKLGEHFTYVSDVNYKCQRSIPMSFFDQFDGQSRFNP